MPKGESVTGGILTVMGRMKKLQIGCLSGRTVAETFADVQIQALLAHHGTTSLQQKRGIAAAETLLCIRRGYRERREDVCKTEGRRSRDLVERRPELFLH